MACFFSTFYFYYQVIVSGVIVINLHQVTEQYDPGIIRQRTVDYQYLPVELSNRSASIWPGVTIEFPVLQKIGFYFL